LNASGPDAARLWVALALLLGAAALLGAGVEREALDWQPTLWMVQPWRCWSAVAVHYGQPHLLANLAGVALVGALGWAARVSAPMVLAWALAWPITHLGLLADPELAHYGGLSGVLHAGVAVAALHLLLAGAGGQRRMGALIALGLAVKVAFEYPWTPVRFHAELNLMVAPLAHLSGLLAGTACGAAAHGIERRRAERAHA
jgi:rhomboid family GlyGly-CTERM serine protease